ncbi:surface antigen BspA-like [Trichomonas vaginalis G3]|uniref:Surface antigen BspA-like n=1 Tax=Trichomonas vaginalis (strain ATCC PRA-98 / G3) TaxID=412133 RepID=A2E1A4_TRIV3|nr:surface antigen family [Trichomonas vaginalis G3]EAY13605.1 surface antigen BspA-like [Trichomonas vaginalis G3]KAI5489985.1 surface antigen family [Trichomonas vaginalis G3]|eukprot:XP_001325828.1 surface antigen BspA-like [Trichomonas vaginalis G3]
MSLGVNAFGKCKYLKSVILPPNIYRIEMNCFANDYNLTSIDLPDSLVFIECHAFEQSGLEIINISPNSKLEALDYSCFEGTKLSSIFIPKFVRPFETRVFDDCIFLENITVDPENKNYKSDSKSVYRGTDNSTLFKVVSRYLGEYIVAKHVTKISYNCFSYCVNISSIQLHNELTSIEEYGISKCTSLKSIIIKGNISKLNNGIFAHCSSLPNIIIPEIITDIGKYAFYNCTSLTNITIPKSVTKIDSNTFSYCISLTNFTIPETITDVGEYAFKNCTLLTNITIPKSVSKIDSETFSYCISLTNFTIPETIIEIGSDAFSSCTSLVNIVFHEKLTRIGPYAFGGCTSLTNVSIPESINHITDGLFHHCNSLTSFIIPNNVKHIGRGAFANCRSLTTISIPENVTYIGDYVFGNCIPLASIIIPGSISNIEFYAFKNCTNLKSIYFRNISNFIRFDRGVFSDIPNPMNIYIPGNFNLIDLFERNIFPNRSHLFVTSQTRLSQLCKILFGEKSVYVHMQEMTHIQDNITNKVIEFIAIDIIYQKTKHKCVYDKTHSLFLSNTFACLNRGK